MGTTTWTKDSARVTVALDALGRAEEVEALRERYVLTEPEKPKSSCALLMSRSNPCDRALAGALRRSGVVVGFSVLKMLQRFAQVRQGLRQLKMPPVR